MKTEAPLILYIEDNHDNMKLVRRVLQAAGFQVVGRFDGRSALEFVHETRPDLILIDIQLPGMDGYTLMRELHKISALQHVPLVALSANVLQEDQDRCFKAGCAGFIHKPIDVDLLPKQVDHYLK